MIPIFIDIQGSSRRDIFPIEVGESRDILASKVVEALLDLKKSRSLRLKMLPDLFSGRPDVRIVGIVDPLGYLAHACPSVPNGSSTLLFLTGWCLAQL